MHSEMNLGGGGTDLSISFHNNPLLKIFENKTLHLVMIIVLSLGILLRPLPEQLQSFMKTPVARIVGVCLIVLFGNKSPIVSVLLGVFLVLSFMEEGINNSQKEIKEKRIITSNNPIIPHSIFDQLVLKSGQSLEVDFIGTNQNGIQFRLSNNDGLLTI